jgi:propanol-preferring alcohol dehydrogenase
VAVVLAANPTVIEQAHSSLRRGGRLILVAMPKDNAMSLPIFQTVVKGISVIGSIVGTRADLAEVFRLHAAGRTTVLYDLRKLDEINDSIDDVLASRVPARLVLRP